MRYRLLGFDLDDTLVYTKRAYAREVFRETFSCFGKSSTDADADSIWYCTDHNGGRAALIAKHGIDPLAFWKEFQQRDTVERRIAMTKAYRDVLAVLPLLRTQGYLSAIVTNAPQYLATPEAAMAGEFDALVATFGEIDIKHKPSGEGILYVMRRLGVPRERTLFIGNGGEDIAAAKDAGVTSVLLRRGDCPVPAVAPDYTVRSMYSLRNLLTFS